MKREMALLAALALLVFGSCTRKEELDQLAQGHANLKTAPCGSSVAIAGVAGVNSDPNQIYLGDWVVVSICHMDTLMERADQQQQPLTLYIEGIDTGNEPTGIDRDHGIVTFIAERTPKNKLLWNPLLYNPLFDPTVTIHVSAGIRGDRPLPRLAGAHTTLQLSKIFFDWSIALWLAVLLIVVALFLLLAHRSDMLRDGAGVNGVRQPYSLARTQMAWWFLLILIGYTYIWIVTGDRDTIAASLLGLMGISAATAIAAAAIPSRRGPSASSGFWADLVVNEEGIVALDRVQIVAWTLVLGLIFFYYVIWDLTMPEFSATMLALMGISSGTYIGFKLPTKAEEPKA